MEHKKLYRGHPLFFNAGLALALLIVLAAFEWKTEVIHPKIDYQGENVDPTPLIPITIQKPPKPLKILKPEIVSNMSDIENELEKLQIDVEINTEPIEVILDEPEPEKPDIPVTNAQVMPTPKGGLQTFYEYVYENIEYSKDAIRLEIEGKVYVKFIVDKNGNITRAEVLKGVHESLDREALRVISSAPPWNPGRQGYRPVSVIMVLPVTFKLQH